MGNYNLATDLTIPAGGVYYYRLTIKFEFLDINQELDKNAKLLTKFRLGDRVVEPILSPVDKTMTRMGLKKKAEPLASFATVATTDETSNGLYPMEDDYGTSYYFRGAVENNYMKFGGFYWRIIRINGDGSVRMIYDGTNAYLNANGGDGTGGADRFTHTEQVWNTKSNDNKYVGWMYGGTNGEASTSLEQAQTNETNSDIKTVVDGWYETNIADKGLGKYVGDEIFCNDRSISTTPGEWWSNEGTADRGFGSTPTAYGVFSRFIKWDGSKDQTTQNTRSTAKERYGEITINGGWNVDNPSPMFVCLQKNDRFTVDDEIKGNGDLTYPVGLITVDEIVAAGGLGGNVNKFYYLYKNSSYSFLTFSPLQYVVFPLIPIIRNGNLVFEPIMSGAVAPVINISADYAKTLVGNGTTTSPYQIPGVE